MYARNETLTYYDEFSELPNFLKTEMLYTLQDLPKPSRACTVRMCQKVNAVRETALTLDLDFVHKKWEIYRHLFGQFQNKTCILNLKKFKPHKNIVQGVQGCYS